MCMYLIVDIISSEPQVLPVKFCSLSKRPEKVSPYWTGFVFKHNFVQVKRWILTSRYIISHISTFISFPLMTTNNGQSRLAQTHWYVVTKWLCSALVVTNSHSLNSRQEFSGSFNPDAGLYNSILRDPEFIVWTIWMCKELSGKILLENFGTKPNWLVTPFPVCCTCTQVVLSLSKALWCSMSVVLKNTWLGVTERKKKRNVHLPQTFTLLICSDSTRHPYRSSWQPSNRCHYNLVTSSPNTTIHLSFSQMRRSW